MPSRSCTALTFLSAGVNLLGMSKDRQPPSLGPEEGWTRASVPNEMGFQPTFVSGANDSDRLRVRYYLRASDQRVVGKAWFGPGAQGPPGHAHGGSISALLDEAMGLACWMAGHTVVAAKLTITFIEMLPLGQEIVFEAWVKNVDGRKIVARSLLHHPDGNLYGKGSGLFIVIDAEKFKRLLSE
jgi:acyl-coenzyme A thioesterase PaaI-like protein